MNIIVCNIHGRYFSVIMVSISVMVHLKKLSTKWYLGQNTNYLWFQSFLRKITPFIFGKMSHSYGNN